MEQLKSVFSNSWNTEQPICVSTHTINGGYATLEMLVIDNTTTKEIVCDCGNMVYFAEMCGCADPHLELKVKQNVNY